MPVVQRREPEDEPQEAPDATPEPPRLVTSTRRRRRDVRPVRRCAASESAPEPVDVPVEPGIAVPDPQGGPISSRDDESNGAPGEDDENGNGFSLLHVPIKRKGSRKR